MVGKRELWGINRAWRAGWCACGGATQKTSTTTFCNWLFTADGKNIQNIGRNEALFWQPGCCFQINSKQRSLRHQKRAPPTDQLSLQAGRLVLQQKTQLSRNAAVKADVGRRSHSKEREEEEIWEQEEKLTLVLLWCWYHLFSPSSVKRL